MNPFFFYFFSILIFIAKAAKSKVIKGLSQLNMA